MSTEYKFVVDAIQRHIVYVVRSRRSLHGFVTRLPCKDLAASLAGAEVCQTNLWCAVRIL